MAHLKVFTDGASKGNPGPGGYGAVILYSNHVKEIGGAKKDTTNNEMELRAVVEALRETKNEDMPIKIYSDSRYVVDGATGWVFGWKKNGWKTKAKTDVLHRELWEELLRLIKGRDIVWHKVPGHADLAGNERADRIASDFSDGKRVSLYNGSLEKYLHKITDVSYDQGKEEERRTARKRQSAKAYSYVSMVDGEIKTHKTWAECEDRVRGTQSPKYKKALSKEEEREIIAEFES